MMGLTNRRGTCTLSFSSAATTRLSMRRHIEQLMLHERSLCSKNRHDFVVKRRLASLVGREDCRVRSGLHFESFVSKRRSLFCQYAPSDKAWTDLHNTDSSPIQENCNLAIDNAGDLCSLSALFCGGSGCFAFLDCSRPRITSHSSP